MVETKLDLLKSRNQRVTMKQFVELNATENSGDIDFKFDHGRFLRPTIN